MSVRHRYAEGTPVTVAKSRMEMQLLLDVNGCTAFGFEKIEGGDALYFKLGGRSYRIVILKPTVEQQTAANEKRYRYPWQRDMATDIEAEYRRRWRASLMLLKTKLEFFDEEDSTELSRELMPWLVLQNGQTLADARQRRRPAAAHVGGEVMNRPRCQARLAPHMVEGPAGWPEYEYRGECRQRVGVRRWFDALGIERRYCAMPGHREDVDEQARLAELAERVRHDTQPEPAAAPVTAAEWMAVRPEMARLR